VRLQAVHGLLNAARQQGGLLPPYNLICDHRLIGIHGHMLHRDVLLPATSMVIQALAEKCYRPGGFIGELQIFCMCLEIIGWIACPSTTKRVSAASLATANWETRIPSTGSVGFMSATPAITPEPTSETTRRSLGSPEELGHEPYEPLIPLITVSATQGLQFTLRSGINRNVS
jgi:hypothetical protein